MSDELDDIFGAIDGDEEVTESESNDQRLAENDEKAEQESEEGGQRDVNKVT